ncbi:hypothetical protein [Streptomyces sp. NPDC005141]
MRRSCRTGAQQPPGGAEEAGWGIRVPGGRTAAQRPGRAFLAARHDGEDPYRPPRPEAVR